MEERISRSSKIVYVEPNYKETFIEFSDGNATAYQETVPNMEDMCVAVNLIVKIPSKNSRGYNDDESISIETRSNGDSAISFFKGTKIANRYSLSTTPYEYTTIRDIAQTTRFDENGEFTEDSYVPNEMFGITNIDVSFDTYQTVQVKMDFVDIHGVSLFAAEQLAHNATDDTMRGIDTNDVAGSFFKCFFMVPYPVFLFKMKGFYGRPTTYIMSCADFKASFDCKTGNFNATVRFVGFQNAFFQDVSVSMLANASLANKEYWVNQVNSGVFTWEDDLVPSGNGILTIHEILQKYLSIKKEILSIDNQIAEQQEIIDSQDAKNSQIKNTIDRINTLVSYFHDQDKLNQCVSSGGSVIDLLCFFKKEHSAEAKKLFMSLYHDDSRTRAGYATIVLRKLFYKTKDNIGENIEWYDYGNLYEEKAKYLSREVNAINEELLAIDENYKKKLEAINLQSLSEYFMYWTKKTDTYRIVDCDSEDDCEFSNRTRDYTQEVKAYLFDGDGSDRIDKFYDVYCKGKNIEISQTERTGAGADSFNTKYYIETEKGFKGAIGSYMSFDPHSINGTWHKKGNNERISKADLLSSAKLFGVRNFKAVLEDLNIKLGNVPEEVKNAQKNIDSLTAQRQSIIDNKFGFKPTIHNVVKLFFAHLETFVNLITTYADEANRSDRTMKSMGLEETDFNIKGDEKVGAFPRVLGSVTDNGQTRVEDVWIGKLSGGASQPETYLIDRLVECSSNLASQSISIERVKLMDDEQLANDSYVQKEITGTTESVYISAYKYIKTLYDKWLSSQEYTKFNISQYFLEHVHFIDEYYCYIKEDVCIDMVEFCESLANVVGGRDVNYGLLSYLSLICKSNFITVTAIQNFLDFSKNTEAMREMFDAIPFDKVSTEMTRLDYKLPDLVFLQMIEDSNKATDGNNRYKNDSFRIASRPSDTRMPLPLQLIDDEKNTNRMKIPSFGVTYGMQYQSYFKDISVNMDHATATEATIRAQVNIAESSVDAGGGTAANMGFVGQDLFTIWSNNAFECTVTMMGNAYIQPLMYFQLNNIPMFDGTYIIYSVSHSISAGQMTTRFTGNRLCRVQNPRAKEGAFIRLGVLDSNGKLIQEKDIASIYNDCHYAYYKPGSLSFKNGGGIADTWLNARLESTAGDMYGRSLRSAKEKNPSLPSVEELKQKYSVCTIFDMLCCAAWGAVGGGAPEAVYALTFATYVNRWHKSGKKFVAKDFGYNQVEWNTKNGYEFLLGLKYGDYTKVPKKDVERTVELAKKYLPNPLAAVNLVAEVKEPFDLSCGGRYRCANVPPETFTATKTITEDIIQQVSHYAQPNDGGWYHWMRTWATGKTFYVCECTWGNLAHVFANDQGGKKFWTSDSLPSSSSSSDGKTEYTETSFPCIAAKELFDCIVASCEESENTNISGITISKYSKDKYGFLMECSPATGASQLFDIVLQAYYDDIDELQWVCKNDTSENASKIYVKASDGKEKDKKIFIGVTGKEILYSDDMSLYNNLFKMSVYKKTREGFVENFDAFKKVYRNFSKVDTQNASKILDGLECGVESCGDLLESMRPSPTTIECSYDGGSFNYKPQTKEDGTIVYVLYRYKKQGNTINGFIYDTSTNKILCDTIENEQHYTKPFQGKKVNTIVSGCSSWTYEKPYRAAQNTVAREYAEGGGSSSCYMLQIGTSGCLFHLGANRDWSEGCVLVCSNPKGLESVEDYRSSEDINTVEKIRKTKSGQAFILLYKTTYGYLNDGKAVKIEFKDAFAQKNSELPPYGNGNISCKEVYVNTGIGSLSPSRGVFSGKNKDEIFAMLGINGIDTLRDSEALGRTSTIISVTMPYGYGNIRIHKGVADDLVSIIEEIHEEVPTFKGTITSSFRSTETSGNLSNHGRGIAVDINGGRGGNPWFKQNIKKGDWTYNDSRSKTGWGIKKSPYNGNYDKDKCIWSWDHPVVQIFNSHGWGWGGAYGDTMHFSLNVTNNGDGTITGH